MTLESTRFMHAFPPDERDFNLAASGLRLQQGVAPMHGPGGTFGHRDPFLVWTQPPADMQVQVDPGAAWVQDTISGYPNQALLHVFNDALVNVTVPTAHATLPRLDQLFLVLDADSNGSRNATLEYLPGTATAGATLDNRNGADAILYPSSIRLADILVPAAATSIAAADLRDRRPWAYGVTYCVFGAGATTQTFTTTTQTDIGTATKRLELPANAKLNVSMSARLDFPASAAGLGINFGLAWTGPTTGVRTTRFSTLSATAATDWAQASHDITFATAGSYLFRPVAFLTTANATGVIVHNNPASTTPVMAMMLREIVVGGV